MSIVKTVAGKAAARFGTQILAVKTHSPTILLGAGLVGVGSTVALAIQATLKLPEVLAKGEEKLRKVDAASPEFDEESIQKATFGVKLKTAIEIAKLYMPTTIMGLATVGFFTGSHLILQRRNAAAVAAYTILDRGFKDYRGRVIADQGADKDLEYMHGISQREIVDSDEHGDKVVTITGFDQEKIVANEGKMYDRVFAPTLSDGTPNKNWSEIPNQNRFVLQLVQSQLNDLLTQRGYVFLNEAYKLLGFKETQAGHFVGWVKKPRIDEVTGLPSGDGWIDFGTWVEGFDEGHKWINGEKDAFLLRFNVDGPIAYALAADEGE